MIKRVQDVYLQHKETDVTVTDVYHKHIYPTFLISRATFYNYLAVPVNKILKQTDEQTQLFAPSAQKL